MKPTALLISENTILRESVKELEKENARLLELHNHAVDRLAEFQGLLKKQAEALDKMSLHLGWMMDERQDVNWGCLSKLRNEARMMIETTEKEFA